MKLLILKVFLIEKQPAEAFSTQPSAKGYMRVPRVNVVNSLTSIRLFSPSFRSGFQALKDDNELKKR